jgi:hypothetical protein
MNRNYLSEKENPYRFGVLQGNYVEEMYSKDNTNWAGKNSRSMTTETKERFRDPKDLKGLRNEQ